MKATQNPSHPPTIDRQIHAKTEMNSFSAVQGVANFAKAVPVGPFRGAKTTFENTTELVEVMHQIAAALSSYETGCPHRVS